MRGRAGRVAQGALLVLIVLLGMGYMRFNAGLDNAYAACREANDIAACACWREGYAEQRSIFTEVPFVGRLVPGADREGFEEHMAAVRERCGMTV